MYYSYVEIEYVATSFSPTRTDLALKLLSYLVHDALSTHPTDSHCPPCRRREHSNQYCACATPAATPDQNNAFG